LKNFIESLKECKNLNQIRKLVCEKFLLCFFEQYLIEEHRIKNNIYEIKLFENNEVKVFYEKNELTKEEKVYLLTKEKNGL
jgi:excinuclease UvrABC helicase subunit UvrB